MFQLLILARPTKSQVDEDYPDKCSYDCEYCHQGVNSHFQNVYYIRETNVLLFLLRGNLSPTQQTLDVETMPGWCCPIVYDAGPTPTQQWFNGIISMDIFIKGNLVSIN